MKRTLFQILAVAAVGAMCSCSDFLDPYPSAIRSEEYILTNPTQTRFGFTVRSCEDV